ncbi:MAG: ABC transporter substrate-binding protein [Chthoniobacteraceae bacterium]
MKRFFFRLIPNPGRCLAALLALAMASGLAGCDNNPHPRPLHQKRADGQPWVVGYRAISEDPRSLDPQFSYDTLGNAIIAQLYESLLQYSPFKTNPYELEPCLADGMPQRIQNADGSVDYDIRIKKGIYFHDDPCFPGGKGRELTSADFVYTFQRIADPAVECPVLSTLQEFIRGLGEAYQEARKAGAFDYSKPTGALTVEDDYSFRLHLLKPYPQIQFWLAMAFTSPVPREAVEFYNGKNGREQFKFHPVGTGPYRLDEWARSRLIRLARHERYSATRFPEGGWPETVAATCQPLAGTALPLVDEVQFQVIREAIPAWLLFRQGYLDRSGVGKDVFNSVITAGQTLSEAFKTRGVQLFKDVGPGTFYSQFNMDDLLLGQNQKLRQALSTVYNQTKANEVFGNGIDIKAEQLLPPGVVGFDPDFKNPFRTENVEQARKLIAEAGYPGGIDPKTGKPLEITLDVVAGNAESRQRAEFDQMQYEQVGVRIKINENTWSRFQETQLRGLFQMNTGSGWNADYPDPENFFFLFYSKNVPPQGSNYARFHNEEFDRLFERMATLDNGPERLAVIRHMNAILVEQCPIILTFYPVSFTLSQPWAPRITNNAMLVTGKYTVIDPELRELKIREWNRTPLWPIVLLVVGGVAVAVYAVRRARRSIL